MQRFGGAGDARLRESFQAAFELLEDSYCASTDGGADLVAVGVVTALVPSRHHERFDAVLNCHGTVMIAIALPSRKLNTDRRRFGVARPVAAKRQPRIRL